MRTLLRWTARSLGTLLVCCCLGVLLFDTFVVRPALSKIDSVVARAAPSERQPSSAIAAMVDRAYGARLQYLVARDALTAEPNQVEGASQLRRQFTEFGVGLLLPLHLSEVEITVAYLSWAYMGQGVRGLAAASVRYLGVPLESVTAAQAARLVAITHAPSAYLANPERLERRTQYLLSLQHQ